MEITPAVGRRFGQIDVARTIREQTDLRGLEEEIKRIRAIDALGDAPLTEAERLLLAITNNVSTAVDRVLDPEIIDIFGDLIPTSDTMDQLVDFEANGWILVAADNFNGRVGEVTPENIRSTQERHGLKNVRFRQLNALTKDGDRAMLNVVFVRKEALGSL